MTRAQLLDELKKVLRETTYDAAWGDTLLISYLSEGQDRFCEETGFFIDFSNYTVTLSSGVADYAIPSRAIEVLDVWDGSRRLGKFEERHRSGPLGDAWLPGYTDTAVGAPSCWQSDRSTGYITFYPTPGAAEQGKVYKLRLWRYSRFPLTQDDIDGVTVGDQPAVPEIPERFQRSMIHYAAYMALLHHDMEKQDKVKASDHLAIFGQYVRDGRRFMRKYHGETVEITSAPAYRT